MTVVALEARDRIGGRILTHRDPATPVPIELGAEFIHGAAPELDEIVRNAGLAAVDISGRRWQSFGERLRPADDFWERLDRIMRRLDKKRTPDRSFQSFLAKKPGGRRLAHDRRLALQYVEDFHAADPARVSERALAEGGSPRGDVRERRIGRVLDGYDRVTEWLAASLGDQVRTSAVATRVRWAPGNVSIELRHPDGRSRPSVDARAAIVAVPLGVLKAPVGEVGAIEFDPDLRSKRSALDHLAMGSVVRIVLRFSEPFWASEWFAKHAKIEGLDTLSFFHTNDEDFRCGGRRTPCERRCLLDGMEDLARLRSRNSPKKRSRTARSIHSLGRLGCHRAECAAWSKPRGCTTGSTTPYRAVPIATKPSAASTRPPRSRGRSAVRSSSPARPPTPRVAREPCTAPSPAGATPQPK